MEYSLESASPAQSSSSAIFARVMGLVSLTVSCAAGGVSIGLDLTGWRGCLPWLVALGFKRRGQLSPTEPRRAGFCGRPGCRHSGS